MGGFAVDPQGEFVVVQGFAWFLRAINEDTELTPEDQLLAYSVLMNSRQFSEVLQLFSPQVAGGQFDLSPRYVGKIPLPDFGRLSFDEAKGKYIYALIELGRDVKLSDPEWLAEAERLTIGVYGVDWVQLSQ